MSDIIINGVTYPARQQIAFPGSDGQPTVYELPTEPEAVLNGTSTRPPQTKAVYNAVQTLQQLLASPFVLKGSVATVAALANISNPDQNDCYYVEAENCLYGWTGSSTPGWVQVTYDGADYAQDVAELNDNMDQVSQAVNNITLSAYIRKRLIFTRHGLSRATGDQGNEENRVHSPLELCHKNDVLFVPEGYKFAVFYYSSSGYVSNTYDTDGGWKHGLYTIPTDGMASVVLAKDSEGTFTSSDCYALAEKCMIYAVTATKVGGIYFDVGHIESSDDSNDYSLTGNDYRYRNWNYSHTLSTTRWRTSEPTLFRQGSAIRVASGYRFYIFEYDNGTVTQSGWKTGTYVFPRSVQARIILDKSSGTAYYTDWPSLDGIVDIIPFSDVDMNGKDALVIGDFINGRLTASGVDTEDADYLNYRISTKQVTAFPCGYRRTIKVSINPGYVVALRYGQDPRNLNGISGFKAPGEPANGDVIVLPEHANFYSVTVANEDDDGSRDFLTTPITPSDDIGLSLVFEKCDDVMGRNEEPEKILTSAKLYVPNNRNRNEINRYAVIGHTSDCHGDYQRVDNFLRFCDNAGADAACITGDIVSFYPKHQIKWFSNILKSHDVLPAICAGNHDVYDFDMDDDDVYDFMFADVAAKIGNVTGKPWYYKDLTDKKLRIISVNLYQHGGTKRWYTHYTSEQLAWLVSALNSTPENYGVIILSHAPQVNPVVDNEYPTFFQPVRKLDRSNLHNDIDGNGPLYDIVDAFIGKSTLEKTYAQDGSPATVSVSADFGEVATGVEFIAHLTGHLHMDSVCYVPGTEEKQLMLNTTCTTAVYGGAAYGYLADLQDTGRNITDATQDAFNVYVIDRDAKAVKVVRVGSNITATMTDRKYMEIPYAD